jgi:ubiquitin carboxyl-terminal hydrolase 8
LEQSLKLLLKEEELKGANQMTCDRCKISRDCKRKTELIQLGRVLIVVFSRFQRGAYGFVKNDTPVEYPDTLDMKKWAPGCAREYRLMGAVFHYGTLLGGHYTAAVRDSDGDQWWLFDDERVWRIDQRQAHSENAYVLIYECG